MSKVICIMGESGSGKTTSMRNLDPKTTYYIDADKKGLSWKGWRKQYNKENKNYLACDDANIVRQYIKRIAEACPGVKVIVVDTVNGLMVADEMRRSKEKGYDKWVDLAACVWDLVCEAYTYRDDLTIIFTAHTQTDGIRHVFRKRKEPIKQRAWHQPGESVAELHSDKRGTSAEFIRISGRCD